MPDREWFENKKAAGAEWIGKKRNSEPVGIGVSAETGTEWNKNKRIAAEIRIKWNKIERS